MKAQYLVGQLTKGYIRMMDGNYLIGCSLSLEDAKEVKKQFKKNRIYKLVEVKE